MVGFIIILILLLGTTLLIIFSEHKEEIWNEIIKRLK